MKHTLTEAQRASILAGGTELDLGEPSPAAGPVATPPATVPAQTPAAPAPGASTDLVAYLTGQLSEKDSLLINTKAELAAVKASAADAEASNAGLLKIAQAAVGQMQVALGNTNSAEAMNSKDVVAEYERVLPIYKAKLPVGGVSQPAPTVEPAAKVHPLFAERLSTLRPASK